MRLTPVLLGYHRQRGINPVRVRKHRWREGSQVVVPKEVTFLDPRLQVHVEQSGKEVQNTFYDLPWEKKEDQPPWIPEGDDPRLDRFRPRPPPESHPLWKEKAAYSFHDHTKLQYRLEQAKVLTKSLVAEGLPRRTKNLVGSFKLPKQDDLLRRHVLHSVVWDQANEPLPKYHDPPDPADPFKFVTREDQISKPIVQYQLFFGQQQPMGVPYQRQADNILKDMFRLCFISNHNHSEAAEDAPKPTARLQNRYMLNNCEVQTLYRHLDNDLVHVKTNLHTVLYADTPLDPLLSPEDVKETASESLPDLWPVKSTVDMLPKHVYDSEDKLTFNRPDYASYPEPLFPHTIGVSFGVSPPTAIREHGEWWDHEDLTPRALVFTFAAALAQARMIHGPDFEGLLPRPVVLQCVATDGRFFDFITFQLNTTDITNTNGIKNIAWIDAGDVIREDWRPDTLTRKLCTPKPHILREFNPRVFDKFLAMYLNGGVE